MIVSAFAVGPQGHFQGHPMEVLFKSCNFFFLLSFVFCMNQLSLAKTEIWHLISERSARQVETIFIKYELCFINFIKPLSLVLSCFPLLISCRRGLPEKSISNSLFYKKEAKFVKFERIYQKLGVNCKKVGRLSNFYSYSWNRVIQLISKFAENRGIFRLETS